MPLLTTTTALPLTPPAEEQSGRDILATRRDVARVGAGLARSLGLATRCRGRVCSNQGVPGARSMIWWRRSDRTTSRSKKESLP